MRTPIFLNFRRATIDWISSWRWDQHWRSGFIQQDGLSGQSASARLSFGPAVRLTRHSVVSPLFLRYADAWNSSYSRYSPKGFFFLLQLHCAFSIPARRRYIIFHAQFLNTLASCGNRSPSGRVCTSAVLVRRSAHTSCYPAWPPDHLVECRFTPPLAPRWAVPRFTWFTEKLTLFTTVRLPYILTRFLVWMVRFTKVRFRAKIRHEAGSVHAPLPIFNKSFITAFEALDMRFRSIIHIIHIVCLIHACGLETYAGCPRMDLQLYLSADYRVDTTGNKVNTWSDRNGLNLATTKNGTINPSW